ncbi:MAG: hypothetical protein AAFY46_02480, partial [Planctomycetota bacterium]
MSHDQSRLPSLMDEFAAPEPDAPPTPPTPSIGERLKKHKSVLGLIGGLAIGGGMVWAVLLLMPVPKPDYETGAIDDVLSYTLLTTEFVERQLVELG